MQSKTKAIGTLLSALLIASCATNTPDRTTTTVNGVDFRDMMAGGKKVNLASTPTNIGQFLDLNNAKATQYRTADNKILVTKYGPATTRHLAKGRSSVYEKPRSYYFNQHAFVNDYSIIEPNKIKIIESNPYGLYIQSEYTCAIRVYLVSDDERDSFSGGKTSIELNGCGDLNQSVEYIVRNIDHH